MFTYVGLIELTPEGRETLDKAPEYLEKFRLIIEEEGGTLEDTFAIMGPWDFLAIVKYPDNAAAFRALAKIGKLEVLKTETFPVEKVDVFFKTLV
ncbi:MAG TPA: GYD domain-containing protein [Gaiellaceae bacterium]|nr:GYD domain-containing protein [Gaiellaceae bacterium]